MTSNTSPFVRAEALVALIRLDDPLTDIDENDILIKDNMLFNSVLALTLKTSEDGVSANKIFIKVRGASLPKQLSVLSVLSLKQLIYSYDSLNKSKGTGVASTQQIEKIQTELMTAKDLKANEPTKELALFSHLENPIQVSLFDQLSMESKIAAFSSERNIGESLCKLKSFSEVHNQLCTQRAESKIKTPSEISEAVKLLLNGGQYEDAAIMSAALSTSSSYAPAVNLLLRDASIQSPEKLFILERLPLNDTNLDAIANALATCSEKDQLTALRHMGKRYAPGTFSHWLTTLTFIKQNPALQFYTNGMSATDSKESH